MTSYLQQLADYTQDVASGNLDARGTPRSDQDVLGLALHEMAGSLRRLVDEASEVESLRRLDASRHELLNNVSHNLRTPLGIIKGAVSSVLDADRELDDGFTEFLADGRFRVRLPGRHGRAAAANRRHGPAIGADDYLTKPFGMSELVARIRASLRRAARAEQPLGEANFDLGDVHVYYAAAEVSIRGEPIKLTATEYRLIRYLSQNAGRVLLPDQVLESV
ncbi:MAG: hypothetical protein QF719_03995 [Chloroflexota bacterium]|jgi:signal transduction histidine kinase|nr:hypothetical protein [Chloroflexota bacterium]MDP6507617.1 hypothetical protein [Chloroflexota bacterium]MDP6757359.1 hypothetical protein [Chloroflexota bacterium]